MRNPELQRLLDEANQVSRSSSYEEPAQVTPDPIDDSHDKKSESSFLKTIGGFFVTKVEDAPAPLAATSVNQIAEDVNTPTFDAASAHAEGVANKPFDEIYKEANVDNTGFTIDKLSDLVSDPMLKDQPIANKTLVLKMALKSQNVDIQVPITNAVERDRALDAYQKMLNERVESTTFANTQTINLINEQVQEFLKTKNAEMDMLKQQIQTTKTDADHFSDRKHEEEKRLAELITPLLEGGANPVSTGN